MFILIPFECVIHQNVQAAQVSPLQEQLLHAGRLTNAAFRAKISSLRRGYTVFRAQGCYYSFRLITQLKEISLLRKGGSWGWANGAYCSPDPCSDLRRRKHFGVQHVRVCESVCVWRSGRTTGVCCAVLCWTPAGALLKPNTHTHTLLCFSEHKSLLSELWISLCMFWREVSQTCAR